MVRGHIYMILDEWGKYLPNMGGVTWTYSSQYSVKHDNSVLGYSPLHY